MSDFENKPANSPDPANPEAAREQQPVTPPQADQTTRVMGKVEAEQATTQLPVGPLPRRRRSEAVAARNAAAEAQPMPGTRADTAQRPGVSRPPLPSREEVDQRTMARRRMEQPAQGVPRPDALRRASAERRQPGAEAGQTQAPRSLKTPVPAPGYSQSQPLRELERATRTTQTARPESAPQPESGPHKPKIGLIVLVILVLLVASLLLGLLLIPDNAPGMLGTVKTRVTALLGRSGGQTQPVSTEAPQVLDFSAVPTSVQAGQTITFTLATSKSAANVRLVSEDGTVLNAQSNMWDNADSTIWSMFLTMTEPYDGKVRLQILSGDTWLDTDTAMEIHVISNVTETPTLEPVDTAAPETVAPAQETVTALAVVTDAPATQVVATMAPWTEPPTAEPVGEVTEAPVQEVTAEPVTEVPATSEPAPTPTMVISPTPTIPVETATVAPVLVGQTPEPAADDTAEQIPQVLDFNAARTATVIPGPLSFTLTTTGNAQDVRLMNDEGEAMLLSTVRQPMGDECIWMAEMAATVPYDGLVFVQVSDGTNWYDTAMSIYIRVQAQEEDAGTGPEEDDEFFGEYPDDEYPDDEYLDDEYIDDEYPDDEYLEDEVMVDDEFITDGEDGQETAPGQEQPAVTAQPEQKQDTAAFVAAAAQSASPTLITDRVVYDGNSRQSSYVRDAENQVSMAEGSRYMLYPYGVMTFRGDNFRQNAAFDVIGSGEPTALKVAWKTPAGSVKTAGGTSYGIGWTGQPAIVKWSSEVRTASNIVSEKKVTGLREVIIAGEDGKIYFLDLTDGQETRKAINVGYPLRGTPSIHPYGLPLMTVGQFGRKLPGGKSGDIGLRVYNLLDQKQMTMIDGLDKDYNRPYYAVGAFDTSSLYDAKANTLISAGTNGMLYLTRLDAQLSINADGSGEMSIGSDKKLPSIVMKSRVKGEADKATAVEASMAMYGSYIYYADMAGILRCVDANTMEIVWAVNTGDAVEATIALDLDADGTLWLYTANTLQNRKKGDCQIRRYNAATGEEDWTLALNVTRQKNNVAGAMASPVIGQNGLSGYAYFTVSYVSKKGASTIGVTTKKDVSLLVCVEKGTGNVVWAYPLSSYSYSSPVAVYNDAGKGWIVQASNDGTLVLLDGVTGEKVNSLKLDGQINASPAVYKNTLVIGTQGKKKGASAIYAITIE